MSYTNNSTNFIIRPARPEDETSLVSLHYQAYRDRYFNPEVTDKYGASLRIYPELIPDESKDTGQSMSTFRDYWREAMPKLNAAENRFICFVAEEITPEGSKIVGFRKGYASPPEDEEYYRYQKENRKRALIRKKENYFGINTYNDTRPIPLTEKNKIAASSSLYIDPAYKREGLGRKLIQRYAQEIIRLGFDGMISSCYIRNDSQKFLRSMGGDYFIKCDIPCTYRRPDKKLDVCNIEGLMCLWDKKALAELANGPRRKQQKQGTEFLFSKSKAVSEL